MHSVNQTTDAMVRSILAYAGSSELAGLRVAG